MALDPANAIVRSPENRLAIDYRRVPPRKTSGPLIDAHTHLHPCATLPLFFEAADLYGVRTIFTMTQPDEAAQLQREQGDRVRFIAIPNWRRLDGSADGRASWLAALQQFREMGSRLCKFWMAPPMRGQYGLTLQHEHLRPVIDRAVELGYDFMTHVGDPSLWWRPGGKYADTSRFGTKTQQYEQLEWFLDYVRPRFVIGAHLGGFSEDPAYLQGMLDRHANYFLDTSATKWVAREVSRHPDALRAFIVRNAERVLFGSDLVVSERFATLDHYASRYWVHLHLWETAYRGESPIEDPDADPPPLNGVDLPPETLERVYRTNAERLLL